MSKIVIGLFSTLFSVMAISPMLLANAIPVIEKSNQIHIERDDFGMPTITGGEIEDIANAIGLVQAEDRLWQIFLIVQVANGRASQYFGSDFIDSDIMQHQINYTDAEVQNQIDTYFTDRVVTFYQNYVIGINQHVAHVNARLNDMPYELRAIGFDGSTPLPDFTIYDIIRANQFILQSFSPSSIPSYQLTNMSDLDLLTTNFGAHKALEIFNDIDPTTAQVKSQYTVVPNSSRHCKSLEKRPEKNFGNDTAQGSNSLNSPAIQAKNLADKINSIKAFRDKSGLPSLGSNAQVLNASKSASGNPMIRIATQPNFNQPSDFYQIRVDRNHIGFRGNYFTIPTFPIVSTGVFNNFGVAVQVGHLPSNDFLFESPGNAIFQRTDVIQVLDEAPINLPIYRSTSGGWVLTNPIDPTANILTLRSVFIDMQLRALNTFIESSFARSLDGFVDTLLNPAWQSDILLVEGEYVDPKHNIAAFHTGGWTSLPSNYDRRLPQGIPQNAAPSNHTYSYHKIAKPPLLDINTKQGYYVAWNSLFKQGAEGSSDTVFPVGINRVYWLDLYVAGIHKLTFEDLTNINLRMYVANNNTAFDVEGPDEDADLFVILFKKRFFEAVRKNPTPQRLQAIAYLQDFIGDWFDGSRDHILNAPDVSDKRILASVWLNEVANVVLNPYLAGTSREVATATPSDTIPSFNAQGVKNDLTSQANTLSRIFKLAYDNTIFFHGWLKDQPSIDEIIVDSLDFALETLGGFPAQPWGAGLRGIYEFDNALLGPVQSMLMCNVPGITLVGEFAEDKINMISILVLGESGLIVGDPAGAPIFTPHCFDQQPLFTQLKLRYNPPFKVED